MMINNNGFRPGNEYYSQAMQRRMDMMLQNANTLFSLGWLRKRLWKELKDVIKGVDTTEYGNYANVLQGSNEKYFMWQFLSVCQKSVAEVKRIIDNAYDAQAPIVELIGQREELIKEFARMPLSRSWEQVKNDNYTWRNFARRLPLEDKSIREDISRFFEILDHISVITDIICYRADEYGLEVDYSAIQDYDFEQKSKELTDDVLVSAIESISHLMNSNSAWAAIYCVMRDDYGYQNQSQFERKIVELVFNKNITPCPEGTISRTMSNNEYMHNPISNWPSGRKFTKLVSEFRKALKEELA